MDYKSALCGYFYGEGFDYIMLISSSQKQVFKFLFKDGKIYKEDLEHECDKSTFEAAIKGICNEYANKILEHQDELNEYEKIYASQKNFEKFIKRHHFLKYEIRKFQNSISHFYEALVICQSEQQGLKKELKNSIHEASVFKTVANEYAYRVDDIYLFIQSDKNDKINRNIYLLTLLSALFLPINFITGFFGMNTNGMFLSSFKDGTLIVFAFIAMLCVLFFIFYYRSNKDIS